MPYKNYQDHLDALQKRVQSRRKQWFIDNGPCRRCGSITDLQVDHIDPSKKISHRIWHWGDKRRLEELSKCQVLCVECHKKKTRKDFEPPHGTHSRYTSRKCRCDLCRKAHAETNARYR